MNHATLFSGIDGFGLAAEWAGWTNLFTCEINPFCQTILKYHFPHAAHYTDIRTTDFSVWRDRIDVLSGGFPCQPFSQAGKRKGTEDDRYLWPEMLRVIRSVRPRWVVGENVYGIVSWSGGLVFEQVCTDLEAEGYEVQPYILPACGVGAPHRRYRVWFVAKLVENTSDGGCGGSSILHKQSRGAAVVGASKIGLSGDRQELAKSYVAHRADTGIEDVRKREDEVLSGWVTSYSDSDRCREWSNKQKPVIRIGPEAYHSIGCKDGVVTDTQGKSRWNICRQKSEQQEKFQVDSDAGIRSRWTDFPTQSPVCSRDDGFSCGLDGITFPEWRRESIKAYGNAVVPQVVYQIFETINRYEDVYIRK